MPPTPDDSRDKKELDITETPPVILESSSDEDPNTAEEMGYSLLPQDPDGTEPGGPAGDGAPVMNGHAAPHMNGFHHAGPHGAPGAPEEPSALDAAVVSMIDREESEVMSGAGPTLHEEPTPESRALAELWNQPPPYDRLQLDQDQVKAVTEVMSNVSLPPCNHPSWARHMTDEQLKAELHNRLHKQTNTDT